MASILAHAARRVLRPASSTTASSSRAYITPSASLRAKKVPQAAALSVAYEAGETDQMPTAVQEGVQDIAGLVDEAAALQAEVQSIAKPDVRYTALRADHAYDPYKLKKPSMLAAPPSRRNRPPRLGPNAKTALLTDVIAHFDIVPQHETVNPIFLNGFLTDMGKIKGRAETGLSRKSQRMVGKAVRRARAIGVMPTLHRAPQHTFSMGRGGTFSYVSNTQ